MNTVTVTPLPTVLLAPDPATKGVRLLNLGSDPVTVSAPANPLLGLTGFSYPLLPGRTANIPYAMVLGITATAPAGKTVNVGVEAS